MKKTVKIKGEIIGIDFSERCNDGHVMIDLYVQDDGIWYKEFSMSSGWIDDLVQTTQLAQKELISNFKEDDEEGFGYKFNK